MPSEPSALKTSNYLYSTTCAQNTLFQARCKDNYYLQIGNRKFSRYAVSRANARFNVSGFWFNVSVPAAFQGLTPVSMATPFKGFWFHVSVPAAFHGLRPFLWLRRFWVSGFTFLVQGLTFVHDSM